MWLTLCLYSMTHAGCIFTFCACSHVRFYGYECHILILGLRLSRKIITFYGYGINFLFFKNTGTNWMHCLCQLFNNKKCIAYELEMHQFGLMLSFIRHRNTFSFSFLVTFVEECKYDMICFLGLGNWRKQAWTGFGASYHRLAFGL